MQITNPIPRAVSDLGLFLITLGLAYVEGWQASDVAWSMWITSLITGLIYIYVSIFADSQALKKEKPSKKRKKTAPKWVAVGFFVGFFTFHFGGFHYGHSQFMRSFFPLNGLAVGDSFLDILRITISLYYGFILVGIARMTPKLLEMRDSTFEIDVTAPYAFVVRNHIMIILLGLGGLFNIFETNLVIYIIIAFYFFPFDLILKHKKQSDSEENIPPSS